MPGFQSPNYTQSPNDWYDELLPLMGYAETKVTAVLIRNTFGFHKKRCELSLTALARKTGLSESNVLRGAESAEQRGIIRRLTKGQGRRRRTVWEVIVDKSTTSTAEVVDEKTTSTAEVALPLQQRQTTSAVEGRINKQKETKKNTLTTSAALNTSAAEPAAAAVHGDWWSLDVLVLAGKLPPKHRKAVSQANPSPGAFVSKYLYALAKAGFNKPPLWAASQVASNPGAWEGEPYESLAALGPRGVADVLAWVRDDAAYPLNLNGATPLALMFLADLRSKFKKEPARLYAAAAEAIADLGLARLVQPVDLAEPEPAAPAAPELDAWQAFLRTCKSTGELNNVAYDRLARCRLVSFEGGQYVVSVPTRIEYDWLTLRFAAFAKHHPVTYQLQEE
jgi:hypothetical protein